MKIASLTVSIIRIPLRKPIRHASHTRTETENLLVRCVLDDGTEGFGEGVPREYVTGETANSAIDQLRQSELGNQWDDCPDFDSVLAQAERMRLRTPPDDERQCQGNAARCAVELALLDAFGKHFGKSLREVPKLLVPELVHEQEWVRYSGAITSAKGFKLRLASWMMRLYRFRQLKVKVGIEGYDDVARLKTIRGRVSRKMDLRIDANEAWSPDETVERILELTPFGITSVEQPVLHEQVAQLRDVRQAISVPIMLDESLCSRIDAEQAIADETCDLFNIRLSKCGGFIPSLRLAELAKRHHLGYQLGCQVGETAILSAAGRHFASTVKDIRYLEGSYDRHLVREALSTQNHTFGWGGWAKRLEGPGLGIELDPKAIQRVTVRTESLMG